MKTRTLIILSIMLLPYCMLFADTNKPIVLADDMNSYIKKIEQVQQINMQIIKVEEALASERFSILEDLKDCGPNIWETDSEFEQRIFEQDEKLKTKESENEKLRGLRIYLREFENSFPLGWAVPAEVVAEAYDRNNRRWPMILTFVLDSSWTYKGKIYIEVSKSADIRESVLGIDEAIRSNLLEGQVILGIEEFEGYHDPLLKIKQLTVHNPITGEYFTEGGGLYIARVIGEDSKTLKPFSMPWENNSETNETTSDHSIIFGMYNGEPIAYTYGNYFYDQVQIFGNEYKNTGDNATQSLYQIWKSAYDSTVLFTAVTQLASKAGIIAVDETVNKAIINSGAYNKDGKFDVELYQKATAERKASVDKSIRRSVPYQIVIDDIGSALSSFSEADYVAKMASEGRTFNYVDINASLYPDEKASAYALLNKQLFYSMDLSIISVETEDEAKALSSAIASGEKTFEETALSSSKDNYAAKEGKVGNVFYFGLISNFKNPEDATKLLTAKSGDMIGPLEGQGAWSIYRRDSTPLEADYASPALLSTVKAYLASSDDPVVDDYLLAKANEFALDAKNDFAVAAEKAKLDLVNVAGTPYNLAQSTYMNNFNNTDPQGKLARAVTTTELGQMLYTAELGTIIEPIKSNTSYLVVQADKDVADEGIYSYIQMFYNYLSGSQNQQDFSQVLNNSNGFEDNFLTTFYEKVLGTPY